MSNQKTHQPQLPIRKGLDDLAALKPKPPQSNPPVHGKHKESK